MNQQSHLIALAEIGKTGTYTAAGRALGVAHTTVARKIQELETFYGARLVERVGERIVLTQEGEAAAHTGRKLHDELLELERTIKGRDSRLYGHISLTTVDVLAWRYMDKLQQFSARFPDIELTLSVETEVRSLSRREAQVALRLTGEPESYLYGNRIGELTFAPYACRERFGDQVRAEQFSDIPWIGYSSQQCGSRAEAAVAAVAPAARMPTLVPTPLMMLRAVECGLGAGFCPVEFGEQRADLVRLPSQGDFTLDIWLLTPRELRRTGRIRALFETFFER